MDIKQLDKAAKILQEIKELDEFIIKLDAIASVLVNNETKSTISITVQDLDKSEEQQTKVSFDNDGSLVVGEPTIRGLFNSLIYPTWLKGDNDSVKHNSHNLTFDLPVNLLLNILGVVLYDKKAERDYLIQQLNKIGVTI